MGFFSDQTFQGAESHWTLVFWCVWKRYFGISNYATTLSCLNACMWFCKWFSEILSCNQQNSLPSMKLDVEIKCTLPSQEFRWIRAWLRQKLQINLVYFRFMSKLCEVIIALLTKLKKNPPKKSSSWCFSGFKSIVPFLTFTKCCGWEITHTSTFITI